MAKLLITITGVNEPVEAHVENYNPKEFETLMNTKRFIALGNNIVSVGLIQLVTVVAE